VLDSPPARLEWPAMSSTLFFPCRRLSRLKIESFGEPAGLHRTQPAGAARWKNFVAQGPTRFLDLPPAPALGIPVPGHVRITLFLCVGFECRCWGTSRPCLSRRIPPIWISPITRGCQPCPVIAKDILRFHASNWPAMPCFLGGPGAAPEVVLAMAS